ncbi:hypothetical protein PQO03_02540 [Lentisphaera profundi]|uniref:Uncharacterized protein n=1 Tax=Lentisphaera profundi TaxID=1658616 RepID=A0ABY7VXP4_9BACT|nr:hypothetical protein [Lentisphaera profundi]WDE96838.1 hypothetical protein PQO03_02540 [Lentisphaera profundi]
MNKLLIKAILHGIGLALALYTIMMFLASGFATDQTQLDFMQIGISATCVVLAIFVYPKMFYKKLKAKQTLSDNQKTNP